MVEVEIEREKFLTWKKDIYLWFTRGYNRHARLRFSLDNELRSAEVFYSICIENEIKGSMRSLSATTVERLELRWERSIREKRIKIGVFWIRKI